MRPAGPVARTCSSGMPNSQARRRTAGEAMGRSAALPVGTCAAAACLNDLPHALAGIERRRHRKGRKKRGGGQFGRLGRLACGASGSCGRCSTRLQVALALHFEANQLRTHGHGLPDAAAQRQHPARHGRGNLHRGLVGHDVGQHLVGDDGVALPHMPGDQLHLGNAFADVRRLDDVRAHHASMARRKAAPTRAGPGKYSHSWACGYGVSQPVTRSMGDSRW